MWDVGGFDDIGLDSLAVLDAMAPPPEVLVVGCGARVRRLPASLMQQLAARGIAVEALDTVGGQGLEAGGRGEERVSISGRPPRSSSDLRPRMPLLGRAAGSQAGQL
jgi:hypothetical protein